MTDPTDDERPAHYRRIVDDESSYYYRVLPVESVAMLWVLAIGAAVGCALVWQVEPGDAAYDAARTWAPWVTVATVVLFAGAAAYTVRTVRRSRRSSRPARNP